jgi:hypothetical protein
MIIYKSFSLFHDLLLLVVVVQYLTLSDILCLSSTPSSSSITMRIMTLSPFLRVPFTSCYLYHFKKKNILRYNGILKSSTHNNEDNVNKKQQRPSSSSSSHQHNKEDDDDDDAEDDDITINGFKYKAINNKSNNQNFTKTIISINWDPYMAPKLDFDECYYDVLEADQSYNSKELKKAYYKIVFKYHPDTKINEIDKELCNKQMMVSYLYNPDIHMYM